MGKKIISAGHVCLDITPVFDSKRRFQNIGEILEPGKLIHMEPADVHTGGSVSNTGLALKLLGEDVQLMGKIGSDAFGGMIKQLFDEYGASGLIEDENCSTSYSVVLAIPGVDRIFLHNPGANDTFESADIKDESLAGAALFHFGYPPLMKKMYQEDGAELCRLFERVKSHGVATSLDFAAIDSTSEAGAVDWKRVLKNVLPHVDFFVPSFEELCFMLDREKYEALDAKGGDMTEILDVNDDVKPLADTLLSYGCKVVLIKCGTSGMYYKTADKQRLEGIGANLDIDVDTWANQEGMQPCYKADQVLSGTGAGDTSIAAFLSGVLRGKTPEMCVKLAAAEGACAVTTYDALGGIKPIEELEQRLAAGWELL